MAAGTACRAIRPIDSDSGMPGRMMPRSARTDALAAHPTPSAMMASIASSRRSKVGSKPAM